MNDALDEPPDNLVELDLSAFSHADLDKILELGKKQRLLYRWFRCERKTESGLDFYQVYSGARGRTPYAAYRIERRRDGRYWLLDQRTAEIIAQARTLDAVIKRLPENFFYST